MNLEIRISEAVNGYRLDVSDWKEKDFYSENCETIAELFEGLDLYLATYKDQELKRV